MTNNNVKMNLQMFGGWDEVLRDGTVAVNKTEFTKLQNGITEVRFLDAEPFVRWAHWLANAKRNISCIGQGCPVCEAIKTARATGTKTPYNSNRKFAMHVYNYTTGRVEILEQGNHNSLMDKKGKYYKLYTNQFYNKMLEAEQGLAKEE